VNFQLAACKKLWLSTKLFKTQDRPDLAAAAKGTGKITIATDHCRRRFGVELAFRETPKTQHLVHHESRRNFPMVDDDDTGIAAGGGRSAAQKLPQIQHRQQLSANVRQPLDPALRAGDARDHRR